MNLEISGVLKFGKVNQRLILSQVEVDIIAAIIYNLPTQVGMITMAIL
jgi:hypothetical protein